MKILRLIAIPVLSILMLAGCTSTPVVKQASYTDITPLEAKSLIDQNPTITIIDVSGAYADGHLPGAVSYQLGAALERAAKSLDKGKKYLVYCHSETASRAGAQVLVDAGFQQVYRLKGDYDGWVQAGYPVEK